MYYFRFEIPKTADGARVSYSPGWHGTMPKCPQNVVVDLYDDNEGYGVAHTEDTFVPKEVQALKEADAKAVLAKIVDKEGVYYGEKIAKRWLPEAVEEVQR